MPPGVDQYAIWGEDQMRHGAASEWFAYAALLAMAAFVIYVYLKGEPLSYRIACAKLAIRRWKEAGASPHGDTATPVAKRKRKKRKGRLTLGARAKREARIERAHRAGHAVGGAGMASPTEAQPPRPETPEN